MEQKELKEIELNGVSQVSNVFGRKDLFDKLYSEYKEAFVEKFGEPTVIDGVEIYEYEDKYYSFCEPFVDARRSSAFCFSEERVGQSFGEHNELVEMNTSIRIPCTMCTKDSAKIFPVREVLLKIKDGKVVPTISQTATIISQNNNYELSESEKIDIYNEDIMVSTDKGVMSVEYGDVLYNCDGNSVHRSGDEIKMRDPRYAEPTYVTKTFEEIKEKIQDRKELNEQLKRSSANITVSDLRWLSFMSEEYKTGKINRASLHKDISTEMH